MPGYLCKGPPPPLRVSAELPLLGGGPGAASPPPLDASPLALAPLWGSCGSCGQRHCPPFVLIWGEKPFSPLFPQLSPSGLEGGGCLLLFLFPPSSLSFPPPQGICAPRSRRVHSQNASPSAGLDAEGFSLLGIFYLFFFFFSAFDVLVLHKMMRLASPSSSLPASPSGSYSSFWACKRSVMHSCQGKSCWI